MAYYDFEESRSPRRIVTAVAGAVVAVCAAFLVGYAARGGGGHQVAAGVAPSTSPDSPTPSARTVVPPPVKSDSPPTVPAAADSPRGLLHRNAQGVIVGYSHNQSGAVAAAGNYTASVYVHTTRTHSHELALLSSICANPADAARLAEDFTTEDAALSKILGVTSLQSAGVIAYGHPQGYLVQSVSATSAVVDVYVAGGQGVAGSSDDSDATPQTFYEVDEVQLVWRHGDWLLQDWSHLVENDGPEMGSIAAEGYRPFPIGQVSGS